MAFYTPTDADRKKLITSLLHSTMALYSQYEALESISHGADRALLKSEKMTLERIIERYTLHFITGGNADANK